MALRIDPTDLPSRAETSVPAIPAITEDPKVLADAVRRLKELVEVREGKRGSSLDQAVTVRDLYESGVIALNLNGVRSMVDPIGPVQPPIIPPSLDTPPKPTGFLVTGGFAMIFLTWDNPNGMYANHAYTEVYRSTTNNFGDAVPIGQTGVAFFADPVGNAQTYYYWIRFVSTADIEGPINATAGTAGQTASDPAYLLGLLTGQIQETHLFASLNDRINLIDGPAGTPGTVDARIATEATARIAGDNANASLITQVTARLNNVDGGSSGVTVEQMFQAQATTTGPLWSAATTYASGAVVTYRTGTGTSDLKLYQSLQGGNLNKIPNANPTWWKIITAGLYGQYTVKIDANGKVAGFGLANDGVTSIFTVVADKFAIAHPSTNPGTNLFPFIVDGGAVYIDVAFIKDATITSAKIGSLAADKITAGTITATIGLTAANITGGSLTINNKVWIYSTGDTYFSADIFRIWNGQNGILPFYVEGVNTYINTAYIKNLSADKIVSGGSPLLGGVTHRVVVRGSSWDYGSVPYASFELNGVSTTFSTAGHAVMVFSRYTHALVDASATYNSYRISQGKYVFTTVNNTTAKNDLAGLLNGLSNSYVVFVMSSYEAETNATLVAALKRCGASSACQMDANNALPAYPTSYWRTPYALVGVPGRGEGTGNECRVIPGEQAEVQLLWIDGNIGSGGGLTGMTIIEGGKIQTGTITANSIAAGTITGNKIAAGTITADKLTVASLSAISANLGTVSTGLLMASKITCDFRAVDQYAGVNYTSYPMATTAMSQWSMGASTGNLGAAITTSTNLRLYGATAAGSGVINRVKSSSNGGIVCLVNFMGTVDHWVSLWYRISGGSWFHLTKALEPQTGYGFVGFSFSVAFNIGPNDYIDFGFSCTDESYTPNDAGKTEIKYGYASVLAFNI
jgi:hypothetical protein